MNRARRKQAGVLLAALVLFAAGGGADLALHAHEDHEAHGTEGTVAFELPPVHDADACFILNSATPTKPRTPGLRGAGPSPALDLPARHERTPSSARGVAPDAPRAPPSHS